MKKFVLKLYQWKFLKVKMIFFLLLLLFIFYILSLINPQNILVKGFLGYFLPGYRYYLERLNIFFVFFYILIILLTCAILIKILYERINYKKTIYFSIVFILSLLIALGPSLANKRIWSEDSLDHLYIVKLLINNENLSEFVVETRMNNYQNLYYHKIYALLSNLTGLNPHFIFLYIAPFIQFSIFFIGIFLIHSEFFNKKRENNLIFYIIFLFTMFLSMNFGIIFTMMPWIFIATFMPLVIYLSYKFSIINFIFLIIINFFSVQSHVYGYLLVAFTFIALILRFIYFLIKRKELKITYFHVLILNGLLYIVMFLIILFPFILTSFISILPLSDYIKEYIIINWNTGGTFVRSRHEGSLYRLLLKSIEFMIIFFVIFYSQFRYSFKYQKKKKFEANFQSYLRLFVNITSIFVILSLFYGAGFLFFRVITFIMPIYIFFLLFDFMTIIDEKRFYLISKCFKLNSIFKKKSTKVFLILSISLLSITIYDRNLSYTEEQYNACYWINTNLPEDSRFVTSLCLTALISGVSMRWATPYMNMFFDDFDKDEFKTNYYPLSYLYLFIDINPPHTFPILPIFHGNLTNSEYTDDFILFLLKLNSLPDYYRLIYDENSILIYEILRYKNSSSIFGEILSY